MKTQDDTCTCPADQPDVRDKDCPEHGLATLELSPCLRKFRYGDGIEVMAETETAADAMHARMLARRSRS